MTSPRETRGAVFQRHQRARGQRVDRRDLGVGEGQFLALAVHQLDGGAHVLAAALLGIQHHGGGQAGHLIELRGHGQAIDEVLELHEARHLGHDRVGMRIPGCDHLACGHRSPFLCGDEGPVGDLVALALAAEVIDHAELARARHRDQVPLLVLHGLDVVEADHATVAHLDGARRRGARGRATDVEGTHGELRARLADRLRGDDAHGLADGDRPAARQVAPVAVRAHAVAGLAGDRGTHLDLVHALGLEQPHQLLIEQRADADQHVLVARLDDVLGQDASQHALAECLDDVAAFDQRGHRQAIAGAAVLFRHHQVLGDVDQTARQVTGVGGLQRRVREALAGAVGGDEVLQHVQPLTEVRRDRGLDDRAVGLGHEAAHAGELADLGRGTARAGIGHHEDRVERLLLVHLAARVGGVFRAELLHHGLGDLVIGARPDVDHLVVALAVGDETGRVLVLDLLHLVIGRRHDAGLLLRDDDVIDAEGDARARGVVEAGVHQLVGEDHGLLQTRARGSRH